MPTIKSLEDRVAELETKVLALESKIDENTTTTNAIKADTTVIMNVMNAIQGGVKVLEWLGKPARAVTAIVIAVGVIRGWFTDLALAAWRWIK